MCIHPTLAISLDIIARVENNPSQEFLFYSYDVIYDFANEIKNVVIDYYQSLQIDLQCTAASTYATYQLQDSTLWSNTGFLDYNCYAYSINRYENPNQYSTIRQYQIGDFSKSYFDMNLSIISNGRNCKKRFRNYRI